MRRPTRRVIAVAAIGIAASFATAGVALAASRSDSRPTQVRTHRSDDIPSTTPTVARGPATPAPTTAAPADDASTSTTPPDPTTQEHAVPEPGDDRGVGTEVEHAVPEPGDDHGRGAEPGDDHPGRDHARGSRDRSGSGRDGGATTAALAQ